MNMASYGCVSSYKYEPTSLAEMLILNAPRQFSNGVTRE